jgi:amino acid permease
MDNYEKSRRDTTRLSNLPDKKANLTSLVIIWVRMTLGMGLFNNPKRFADLGYAQGTIYFLAAMMLSYYTF